MATEKLADDLVVGTKAIADYTGLTRRQIFHLAENKRLPLFKIGSIWAGRKSEINRHFSTQSPGDKTT